MAWQHALQNDPADNDICLDDGYGDAADIAEVEALIHAPAVSRQPLPPPVLLQDASAVAAQRLQAAGLRGARACTAARVARARPSRGAWPAAHRSRPRSHRRARRSARPLHVVA